MIGNRSSFALLAQNVGKFHEVVDAKLTVRRAVNWPGAMRTSLR